MWDWNEKGFKINIREANPKKIKDPTKEHFEILSEYEFCGNAPYDGRLTVEEQENGTLHLHYNNLRIELTKIEFLKFAKALLTAFIKIYCQILLSKKEIATFLSESYPNIYSFLQPKYKKIVNFSTAILEKIKNLFR